MGLVRAERTRPPWMRARCCYLTLLVREQSPEIWERALNIWSRKESVRDLLISNEVVIQFEWNWRRAKPVFKALMPVSPGRNYPGEFQCVDLTIDPSDYAIAHARGTCAGDYDWAEAQAHLSCTPQRRPHRVHGR